ncbi:phosphatidylethanolamine-binding protein [Bisporella sp. PMI_857]|nr:phosphatidylethanolamine-binding protein [Bisporella sp. PMI_857]
MATKILLAALLGSCVTAQTPPSFEFPSLITTTYLNVSYPAFTNAIVPGQLLDLASVRANPAPTISFPAAASDPSTIYTLIMIDPDARLPNGTARQVLHWLQGNITSQTPFVLNNASATAIYRPPGPPPEVPTRAHRYIQLLFAKPLVVPEAFSAAIQARIGFDVESFVAAADLGEVVAANYYLARNDSLVSNGTSSAGGNQSTTLPANIATDATPLAWSTIVLGIVSIILMGGML